MATTLYIIEQKKCMCIGTEGQFVQNNIFSNIYIQFLYSKKIILRKSGKNVLIYMEL